MRLAVDVVLLAEGHVLLVERENQPFEDRLALPGGFVEEDELLDAAARRELAEETGVVVDSLRFVSLFDDPDRDPRGRVVSTAYLGVLERVVDAVAGGDAAGARWVSLDEAANLAFDHDDVLAEAMRLVR